MVIFHSYVSLPEGSSNNCLVIVVTRCSQHFSGITTGILFGWFFGRFESPKQDLYQCWGFFLGSPNWSTIDSMGLSTLDTRRSHGIRWTPQHLQRQSLGPSAVFQQRCQGLIPNLGIPRLFTNHTPTSSQDNRTPNIEPSSQQKWRLLVAPSSFAAPGACETLETSAAQCEQCS